MLIEIFEIKGSEISTDLDILILDLNKRRKDIRLRKVDVFNKDQIRPHKDIIGMIKKEGIDILPVIKADGKIVSEETLQHLLKKTL